MLELVVSLTTGFVSGSIPWAVLLSNLFVGKDIRSVGDDNPGATNAWKLGGWVPETISLTLDIAKSLVPVYFAVSYLGHPSAIASQISLSLIANSPIVGHGWSPFLHFKGGKALAASWGSWIAITSGNAFPVGCIFLGLIHGFQKNHAITVTLCLIGFVVVFSLLEMQLFVILFGITNLMIVFWKHRSEYSDRIIIRKWVPAGIRVISWKS